MKYREHCGLNLSALGVGCYGLSGVYGEKDISEYRKTLLRAYELGINFFDTADAYGNAEQILGEVLQPYRSDVYIATKVGAVEGQKPNLSRQYIQDACEASLRRLGTEYIDLYQVHFYDPDTPAQETIEAMEILMEQGKIHKYGIGHVPIDQALDYFRFGNLFSTMVELSAVARDTFKQQLPLCQENNIAIIAFSITGRGLLSGKIKNRHQFEDGDIRNIDPLFQRNRFKSGLRTAGLLQEIGYAYARSPIQIAIAWVLAQPQVFCALTGPSKVSHLEENIGGIDLQMDSEHFRLLDTHFAEEDAWLIKQDRNTIKQILSNPLEIEQAQAFTDLVYVIETGIAQDLVAENDVIPIFFDLLKLRYAKHAGARSEMEAVHVTLADLFEFDT